MFGLNIPSESNLIVAPSWSLGVEISFYLLAPFILNKGDKFLHKMFFLGVFLRFIPYGYRSPLFAGMDCFIAGAFAYRKIYPFMPQSTWSVLAKILIYYFTIAPIIFVRNLSGWGGGSPHTTYSFDLIIFPFFYALIVPYLFSLTKDYKLDRYIAELSFPFYIFHQAIINLFSGTGFDVTNMKFFYNINCFYDASIKRKEIY